MSFVTAPARIQLPPSTQASDHNESSSARSVDDVGAPSNGLSGGLASMGRSLGNTLTDLGTFAGIETNEDGSLAAGVDVLRFGGVVSAAAVPTAVMALAGRTDALSGTTTSYLDKLGTTAAKNSIKVTPTLVSAVLGPAIADGVTMVIPKLVPKYQDVKELKIADEKKAAEKSNQQSKIARAVAGGAVVGLAAGAIFLLKPSLFNKFGSGVTHAIEGSTQFKIGAQTHKLTGVLDETAIRNTMAAIGKQISADTPIKILKSVSPMARDAVFSNRLLMAGAGATGTLLLANSAAGSEDPDRKKLLWGMTAAAGAATVGATWGIGKLTQRSQLAAEGAGGILSRNQLFWKPNIEWIKKYGSTIAPITAIPAGTAASQYFNVVNDFDEITGDRSPFRN